MLEQLLRANAVDGKWAEATIAQAETLEDVERAVAGTADNRWRIPRMNGKALVREARTMRGFDLSPWRACLQEPRPFLASPFSGWGPVT